MIGFATSITHFSDPNVETNPNDHVLLDQKDQTNSFRKRKPDIPQVSFQNLHWINTCNVNIHIYTPETDMEPENTPLKRRSIYRPAIFEFHVSFWGCIYPLNYRKWSQMYIPCKSIPCCFPFTCIHSNLTRYTPNQLINHAFFGASALLKSWDLCMKGLFLPFCNVSRNVIWVINVTFGVLSHCFSFRDQCHPY